MAFFRPERALSQLLRHDPFSSFLSRSSFHSPLSRILDAPHIRSPLCAPFFTVFEDARSRHDRSHVPQQTSDKAAEQSSQQSQSTSSTSPQVVRGECGEDQWLDRRQRRHRGHRHFGHHPLSLFSPLHSSPFPSLFHNAFAPFAPFAPLSAALQSMPDISVDMFSTPQAYSVHAAVPGLDKKDIKITVEDGILTIEAERRHDSRPSSSTSSTASPAPEAAEANASEAKATTASTTTAADAQSTSAPAATSASSATQAAEGEDDGVDVHHVESFYGRVERSVQLPEDAKVDELTAKYENGVIKIEIPRLQEQKKQGRKIEIQ